MLYGVYDLELAPGDPVPAKGRSKDRKPDLKQLVSGRSLHGSQAIPLVATVMDGNTSDTAVARDHLKQVVELLPDGGPTQPRCSLTSSMNAVTAARR